MEDKKVSRYKKNEVPIWEKSLLTLNEASEYTGIGINRLRRIANNSQNKLVVWVGSKRMFKRKQLDEYIEKAVSI
ncbi:MAG: helix-turn-helix domain-containing protein [Erysipelotrichaceae bacterium]|nr:helix-turn-helix domain-containing protein [Erysipelotrichaceae bacterium]